MHVPGYGEILEAGGCVRDERRGVASDDVDFACEFLSYEAMREYVATNAFEIFEENPDKLTIRASVPEGHPLRPRTRVADFVVMRSDSATSDGRRPEKVTIGKRLDDQARRDFTQNSLMKCPISGEVFDPFGGGADIDSRILRFVGVPIARIAEDALRVLRGFRFMITQGLTAEPETWEALVSERAAAMLADNSIISEERIFKELNKMLNFDTEATCDLFWGGRVPKATRDAIFRDRVRLTPTLKKAKRVIS